MLNKGERRLKNIVLKSIREKQKLTQKQVATAIGLSEISYQRIEYGKQTPSLSTAFKLADVLNSTVEELFKKE